MRIIAGKFRSRQLKSAKGMPLRPTSDRLRETLFNILGERTAGSWFVDVFAGTGAVGIEAVSRGAREVVFIEKHAAAAKLIQRNLEALDVKSGALVLAADAVHGLEIVARQKPSCARGLDIVFLDPPYDNLGDYERVLSHLAWGTLLSAESLVIVEHRRNFELFESYGGLQRVRTVRQGDTLLSFFRCEK